MPIFADDTMLSVLLAASLLLLRLACLIWREAHLYAGSLCAWWGARRADYKDFHRLSKPIAQLKPSYDVVVIGSGYGGGVAASRMARAIPRQSVCLLERGQERWPGEYPATLWAIISELRFTGRIKLLFTSFAFDLGKRTGLYHWVVGRGSNVFVGSGKAMVVH